MSKYFDGEKLSGYEESPITYVYGGNLEECHNKISDLEAKLAEKEQTITTLIEDSKASKEWLKKQLAEKEKELEEVNREFVQSTHDWKEIVDEKIKAKTEFAIEKLQRVKEFVNYAKIHKIDMINTHQLYEFMCQIIKEIGGKNGDV